LVGLASEKQKDRRISGGLRASRPVWLNQPGGALEGRWWAYGLAVNRHSADMPAEEFTAVEYGAVESTAARVAALAGWL